VQPLDSDRIPIVGQECEQPESRDFYAETGFQHNPFASLEWLLVFEGDGLVAGHSHEEVLCQAPPAERERERETERGRWFQACEVKFPWRKAVPLKSSRWLRGFGPEGYQ
jgi:hypothetical protein